MPQIRVLVLSLAQQDTFLPELSSKPLLLILWHAVVPQHTHSLHVHISLVNTHIILTGFIYSNISLLFSMKISVISSYWTVNEIHQMILIGYYSFQKLINKVLLIFKKLICRKSELKPNWETQCKRFKIMAGIKLITSRFEDHLLPIRNFHTGKTSMNSNAYNFCKI